jgi:hypothetical protein
VGFITFQALAAFGAVPGLMVAVYVAEEDLWFRAVVEEFQPGHQVRVKIIIIS